VVGESAATIGGGGSVDINVTLTRTNDDAGFNYFTAAIVDDDRSGRTGATSNVVVLELVSAPPECNTNADCADGNPCTTDTCNSGSCSRSNNSNACDDGLFCNGEDSCSAGSCSVHTGDPCAARPQCEDTCDETADACEAPAGTPCDDSDACTTDDECIQGSCVGTTPVTCDDGAACNGTETCDAALGCVAGEPIDCSDPGQCLTNPRCEDGECVADPLCDAVCEVCLGAPGCASRCGHPASDPTGPVVATDALAVLTAAVNGNGCAPCVCDVDASGSIVATDALFLLNKVVAPELTIDCSIAGTTSTTTTTTAPQE
jgi:hypothetical protein